MTISSIVLIGILYVLIGTGIHSTTEPSLRSKKLRRYSNPEKMIFIADVFFWPFFLIIAIVKNILK